MPYQLICLDLDGTLVDTAPEIAHAANRALALHGLPVRTQADITLLIGAGAHALLRRLLHDAAPASQVSSEAVLASFEASYAALAGTLCRPYPACALALQQLRDAGVRLACVTNKELRHATRVLQATGLAQFFDLVLGGDSLPEKKPHASVLRHAAATLGVPLRYTAHVGDSSTDVLAARNAGVAAWAVPYGYNGGMPVADCGPDWVFDDLAQMAAHVLASGGDGHGKSEPKKSIV